MHSWPLALALAYWTNFVGSRAVQDRLPIGQHIDFLVRLLRCFARLHNVIYFNLIKSSPPCQRTIAATIYCHRVLQETWALLANGCLH